MKSKYEEAMRDLSRDVDFVDDNYPISDNDDLCDNYVDNNEKWVRIRVKEDKSKRVEEESLTMNDVEDEKNLCVVILLETLYYSIFMLRIAYGECKSILGSLNLS